MVPHLYELHMSKPCFILSTSYFGGGLALIFPTYFLVFKSQEDHMKQKRIQSLPNNLYRIFPSMLYDS
jgi:hypothetical protein